MEGTRPPKPKTAKDPAKIITPADVDNIDSSIRNAATGPVKKKKKKTAPPVTEGSHLRTGHSAGKLTGTAVASKAGEQIATKSERTESPDLGTSKADTATPTEAPKVSQDPNLATDKASRGGRLNKQPSIVREDREGEEQAELTELNGEAAESLQSLRNEAKEKEKTELDHTTTYVELILDSPSDDLSKVTEQSPSASLVLQPDSATKEQKRLSLSPSRSARFSAQPVLDIPGIIKHEPPARAASPAKSALKRSPSPRIPSPSGLTLVEVSDTMSVGSDEGYGSGKKRRNVRVSFDDQPLVVGEGGDLPSSSNSPVIFSPQNKDPSNRPQFGFHRDRFEDISSDGGIAPVPKLPSFGSIRGRRQQDEKPEESGRSNDKSTALWLSSSSDQKVGAVLAQDAASKVADRPPTDPNEPLPPEVTTVEGSGYHSDSESSDDGANGNIAVKSSEHTSDNLTDAPKLPTIAVQPATPGQEDVRDNRDSWLVTMPGSFPKDFVQESKIVADAPPPRAEVQRPPHGNEIDPPILSQEPESGDEDSDDTGDSIYSDAAEDAADLDGDGFGSINAIVDSPIIAPVSPQPPKGTASRREEESPSPVSRSIPDETKWESAKSFWSGVKQGTKPETEPKIPAAETQEEQVAAPDQQLPSSPAAATQEPASQVSPPPKSKLRKTAPTPALLKKSMRGDRPSSQVESTVPLRYPMMNGSRGNADATIPKTLRSRAVAGEASKETQAQPPKQNKNPKPSTGESAPRNQAQARPQHMRTFSSGSDSDSSFKRARKPTPNAGRYTMRRSMRAEPPSGRPQSASFSSASTAAEPRTMRQRPMSTTGTGMRMSLRGANPDPPKASQSRSFGFGKSARPQLKSRKFSDSSDEGPAVFRSRFADSSDEDEPESKLPFGLTPVRGIPKRIDEGDSTDLEDSDEERRKHASASPPAASEAAKSEGSALASGSLRHADAANRKSFLGSKRPEPERKRSLFGALGRKKDKAKFKPDVESAARRDTPLERTQLERTLIGQTSDAPTNIPPLPPTIPRGKLQRRVTPQQDWPQKPPPIPESPVSFGSQQRPQTSDGSMTNRPGAGKRTFSTNTTPEENAAPGKTAKKKRFPMLRKAFGLRD